MRILLTIHHTLDCNTGAPGATLALRDAYRELGHEASIYSHDNLPRPVRGKFAIVFFPIWVMCHVLLRRKKIQYDWVDASTGDAWLLSLLPKRWRPALALRSHGLEHVVHQRLMEQVKLGRARVGRKYFLYRGTLHLWMIALQARRSEVCIALNRCEYECYARELLVSMDRIRLIPNGIDSRLLEDASNRFDLHDSSLQFVFIGTWCERKGNIDVASTMNTFLRNHPESTLLLLGTMVPEEIVEAAFEPAIRRQLIIRSKFERQELANLLSDRNVLLLPSYAEGFALSVLEGMAFGCVPVISSATGAADFLDSQHDAVVVPPGRMDCLLCEIESLANDRSELRRRSFNAKATAQKFAWKTVAKVFLESLEGTGPGLWKDGCYHKLANTT